MRKPKIVWKNGDKPTGRYRSFATRSWPNATLGRDGPMIASMNPAATEVLNAPARELGLSYHASIAETTPLVVRIADHRSNPWKWARLKGRPTGVTEAKQLVERFFAANPDWWEAANAARS